MEEIWALVHRGGVKLPDGTQANSGYPFREVVKYDSLQLEVLSDLEIFITQLFYDLIYIE